MNEKITDEELLKAAFAAAISQGQHEKIARFPPEVGEYFLNQNVPGYTYFDFLVLTGQCSIFEVCGMHHDDPR